MNWLGPLAGFLLGAHGFVTPEQMADPSMNIYVAWVACADGKTFGYAAVGAHISLDLPDIDDHCLLACLVEAERYATTFDLTIPHP